MISQTVRQLKEYNHCCTLLLRFVYHDQTADISARSRSFGTTKIYISAVRYTNMNGAVYLLYTKSCLTKVLKSCKVQQELQGVLKFPIEIFWNLEARRS